MTNDKASNFIDFLVINALEIFSSSSREYFERPAYSGYHKCFLAEENNYFLPKAFIQGFNNYCRIPRFTGVKRYDSLPCFGTWELMESSPTVDFKDIDATNLFASVGLLVSFYFLTRTSLSLTHSSLNFMYNYISTKTANLVDTNISTERRNINSMV